MLRVRMNWIGDNVGVLKLVFIVWNSYFVDKEGD